MEITEYVEFTSGPVYNSLTHCFLSLAADLKQEAFWQTAENRKEYLCNIAEGLGFDPFELENWNKVTNTHIVRNKVRVCFSVLTLHSLTLTICGL